MKIDMDLTEFHEADWAEAEFNRAELSRARYLLRRLRYLEQQLRERHAAALTATGGAIHAEKEAECLEWVLGPDGINYLAEKARRPQTIGAQT